VGAPVPAGRDGIVMRPRALVSSIRPYTDPESAVARRFDLRAGNVDPGLFPLRAWRRCVTAVMQARPPNYGDPLGDPELRVALAHWIGRTRGVVCAPGEVLVTSGTLHGLDLVARVMVEPGEVVAVEEPGYPPVGELLRALGLRVVGVPVDEHGLVVEAIPPAARLVYVTPSHQFPLGMVLSHGRRLALLGWAAAHDATIVEDDYDSQFRYASRPRGAGGRLDSDGRVVYLGTFSKVLSPSLRLGFAVAPPSIVPALAALRHSVDWCPPWPSQEAFTRFIHDGFLDRHVVKATRRYRARRDQIIERLAVAPVPVRPLSASAGLHITVLVAADDGDDDRALHDASAAEDLVVGSLRRCYRFTKAPGGLLVGFGSVPDDEIGDVMDALDRMLLRLGGTRRRTRVS
jgi:GntR family transcriptional regulator / MocR family aminotransferase